MRPGDRGVVATMTKMYVLPLFSRAEQLPFKIPVHVPAYQHYYKNSQICFSTGAQRLAVRWSLVDMTLTITMVILD